MRGDDRANRPISGVSHKTSADDRDLDCGPEKGGKSGYHRIARRPRSRYAEGLMSEDRADSLESLYNELNATPYGMDEY